MAPPITSIDVAVAGTAGLALLALGAFVLSTAPGRAPNRAFGLFALLAGLQTLAVGAVPKLPRDALAFAWLPGDATTARLAVALAVLAPVLLLLFLAEFPRRAALFVRSEIWRLGFALPVLAFAALTQWPFGGRLGLLLSLHTAFFALTAALLAVLALRAAADGFDRARALRTLVGVGLLAAGALLGLLPWAAGRRIEWVLAVLGAGVVAFEIVRFQVVGIERRFRTAVRYAASTTLLVAVLIIGDGYIGEFILSPFFGFTDYYWLFAGLAGVLLFKPIEALANRAVGRVFPDPASNPELYEGRHGRDVYRAQLSAVLRDGVVTARERKLLGDLAAQFAIPKGEARTIEATVRRGLRAEDRLPTRPRRAAASKE